MVRSISTLGRRMIVLIASMIFVLAVASPLVLAERVTCAVKADSWVDAPPFGRTAESAAANNLAPTPSL